MYANPSKDNKEKTLHKNAFMYAFNESRSNNNDNKKRKNNNNSNTHVKKTKSSSKPLSKEDFEKAYLCFLCMGSHPKRNCLKLKQIGLYKDKQVHMVQLLPLESYSQSSLGTSFTHGRSA